MNAHIQLVNDAELIDALKSIDDDRLSVRIPQRTDSGCDLALDLVRSRDRCKQLEEETRMMYEREIGAKQAGRNEMKDKAVDALKRLAGPLIQDSTSGRDVFLAAVAAVERLA